MWSKRIISYYITLSSLYIYRYINKSYLFLLQTTSFSAVCIAILESPCKHRGSSCIQARDTTNYPATLANEGPRADLVVAIRWRDRITPFRSELSETDELGFSVERTARVSRDVAQLSSQPRNSCSFFVPVVPS